MRPSPIAAAIVAAGLLAAGWDLATVPAAAQMYDPQDEWQGLPEADGREEVYYNCVACHSMAIVMQQRLNRRVWDDVLEWMEAEMGMPELPEDDYDLILDYLTEHFGRDSPR